MDGWNKVSKNKITETKMAKKTTSEEIQKDIISPPQKKSFLGRSCC